MRIMRVILPALSCVILAAHFLRDGSTVLMCLSLAAPFLLLVKRRWALYTVQFLLLCGVLVWLETAVQLALQRMALGIPWMRMAVILAAVVLLTAYSAFLLSAEAVRERYG